MTEDFLHYIWKYGKFDSQNFRTTNGEKIEILSKGLHNRHAGADFSNAKIKIGDTIWAGNVEIHLHAGDWYRHKHDSNPAYNNVILHVVAEAAQATLRTSGEEIPTAVLPIQPKLIEQYNNLMDKQLDIACAKQIHEIKPYIFEFWLEKLMVERLQEKSEAILFHFRQNKNNWELTFYQMLARNFGFKLNAQPFEQLARALPLIYLAKHKNNLHQIEAMLFGQAGFLADENGDEYYLSLQKEYHFLQKKFNLKPIEKHLWKFLRLRPVNFPTIRLAQFARLVHRSSALFSRIIETEKFENLMQLFDIQASDYWDTHYVFNKESKKQVKRFGKTAFQAVLINTVVPFLFLYGKEKDDNKLKDRALQFLNALPSEKNHLIKKWEKLNIKAENAAYSQALLQLKNEYCDKKRCLECAVGNALIS